MIIGGGAVAYRKAKVLVEYEADVVIIAPNFLEELEVMGREGKVSLIRKALSVNEVEKNVLENLRKERIVKKEIALMICATNDRILNESIAQWCKKSNIPVNVADQKELCTFLFPAVVKKDGVSIGITTSGTSPSAASYLREQVEELVDDEFLLFLEEIGEYRRWLKQHVTTEADRRQCLRKKVEEWKQSNISDKNKKKNMIQ